MLDGSQRDNIKIGMTVKIEEKKYQGTRKLTVGKVKEILTDLKSHPQGIIVQLETGEIGRVKEIPESGSTSSDLILYNPLSVRSRENLKLEYKSSFRFD